MSDTDPRLYFIMSDWNFIDPLIRNDIIAYIHWYSQTDEKERTEMITSPLNIYGSYNNLLELVMNEPSLKYESTVHGNTIRFHSERFDKHSSINSCLTALREDFVACHYGQYQSPQSPLELPIIVYKIEGGGDWSSLCIT